MLHKYEKENLKNKRTAVIGCGKTGIGIANLLSSWGSDVFVFDDNPKAEENAEGLLPQIRKIFGTGYSLEGIEVIVKSPGVSKNIAPLIAAANTGIPIFGELDIVSSYLPKPVISVTGTNGKTTVTTLIAKIMKMAGYKTFVGGNIGVSIAEAVPKLHDFQTSVLEVSSFQLEDTANFHPQTAVFLNLTQDHLNRHGNMDSYRECKTRIFKNQIEGDTAIINADYAEVAKGLKANVLLFSTKAPVSRGAYLENNKIVIKREKKTPIVSLDKLSVPALINIENLMAAALAVGDVDREIIKEALINFKSLPHRMEHVANINGVDFVNDSKATNVGAVEMSLKSSSTPIILIAGGQDKKSNFATLAPLIKQKLTTLFLIGEASEKINKQVQFKNTVFCSSLDEAVLESCLAARKGDTVLLSPACASFDMFDSYEDRGERFKESVFGLKNVLKSARA